MADDGLDLATRQLVAERQDAAGVPPGEGTVAGRIGMFDVEQHQVGLIERAGRELGAVGIECITAGIEAGVHASGGTGVHGAEQVGQKLGLQQRLAARDGDAAVAVKRAVALELVNDLLDRHERPGTGTRLPRIRVVAEQTAHGAPLREHHEADPRAVDGPHSLNRMNAS